MKNKVVDKCYNEMFPVLFINTHLPLKRNIPATFKHHAKTTRLLPPPQSRLEINTTRVWSQHPD